ncbi:MAG: hypothetical protein CVU55_12765 [Deltaproteobacteria bacterium HGW-Deltaproteobacteria-13]|jgi:hypothetical protein|nr:MAG: hypothetical protein CVU55_12765 [Deltaproteobacteria bacterium HGW-Deltaproteobacteria-13]
MWFVNRKEGRVFLHGKDDPVAAADAAAACAGFRPDAEEEIVADEPVSCYNCRYRRWSADSLTCQKHA